MNFFSELLDKDGKVSSRRLIAIYSLLLLTVVVIADIFLSFNVNDTIYYILSSLVVGGSALSTIPAKNNNNNREVL